MPERGVTVLNIGTLGCPGVVHRGPPIANLLSDREPRRSGLTNGVWAPETSKHPLWSSLASCLESVLNSSVGIKNNSSPNKTGRRSVLQKLFNIILDYDSTG